MQNLYGELLSRYKSYMGEAGQNDADKIYLKHGNEFEKDYHVRMLER